MYIQNLYSFYILYCSKTNGAYKEISQDIDTYIKIENAFHKYYQKQEH